MELHFATVNYKPGRVLFFGFNLKVTSQGLAQKLNLCGGSQPLCLLSIESKMKMQLRCVCVCEGKATVSSKS